MQGDNGASGTENLRNDSVRDQSVGVNCFKKTFEWFTPLTADLHRKPAVEGHQIRDPFLPAMFLLSEIPISASLLTEPRGAANVTPARVVLPLTSEEKFRPRARISFL
jgi:hypothetical protein